MIIINKTKTGKTISKILFVFVSKSKTNVENQPAVNHAIVAQKFDYSIISQIKSKMQTPTPACHHFCPQNRNKSRQ